MKRHHLTRYITWPGQALGYKIGEIRIRQLRNKCEKEMGDKFDVKVRYSMIIGKIPTLVSKT